MPINWQIHTLSDTFTIGSWYCKTITLLFRRNKFRKVNFRCFRLLSWNYGVNICGPL